MENFAKHAHNGKEDNKIVMIGNILKQEILFYPILICLSLKQSNIPVMRRIENLL